jgi:Tol biopolymer transport system component
VGPSIVLGVLAATVFAQPDAAPRTERVSVSSRSIQGNGSSGVPRLSPDGSRVVFMSAASNLVRRDRNRREDLFLRDRGGDRTMRILRRPSITTPAPNPFYFDGRRLGYSTRADTDRYFLRDLVTGARTELGLDAQGRPARMWLDDAPVLSQDGAHFAYTSFAANVSDETGIQIQVRDVAAATTTLVSVALDGRPGNGESREPSISGDGRYVAFHSSATNLIAADANGHSDVFVRDRLTSTTTRVSVGANGAEANGASQWGAVSVDGRLVLFASAATNLVPGDTNGAMDIFVHDRATGETRRVSVTSAGAEVHGESFRPGFLGPRLAGFSSNAADLVPGDTNRRFDFFVHELDTGRTVFAAAGPRRASLPPASYPMTFSSDGRWVGFGSCEPGHVPRDTNRRCDAFVFGPLREPWRLPEPMTTARAVTAAARPPAKPYDFDADGRQDLTIGLPRNQPHGAPDAGGVVIMRGTRRGPSSDRRLITRDTPGVPGLPFGDDVFGHALASADFNGDGFADLAVSVPGDRAVYVLDGSARGLTGAGMKQIELAAGEPEPEFFSPLGGVLVGGRLDRDRYADLVVGSRQRLRLYRGGADGLSRAPVRTIEPPAGARAGFGNVLALGDVDDDGYVDLVEGAHGFPFELDDPATPGHVTYCRGTVSGPRVCRRLLGRRPGPSSLAIADVTGDGHADVIAGVPISRFFGEDERIPPGSVLLFPGGRSGPREPVTITPDSFGVPGERGAGDAFGHSIATARIDSDRFADVVVGAPGSDRGRGRVWIIRGAPSGHASRGNRVLDEGSRGIPGRRARGRAFGAGVSVLDTDGRGRPELVIGVPGKWNGDRGRGAVTIIRRGRARMHSLRTLRLNAPEAPDSFGAASAFGGVLGRPAASSSLDDSD